MQNGCLRGTEPLEQPGTDAGSKPTRWQAPAILFAFLGPVRAPALVVDTRPLPLQDLPRALHLALAQFQELVCPVLVHPPHGIPQAGDEGLPLLRGPPLPCQHDPALRAAAAAQLNAGSAYQH